MKCSPSLQSLYDRMSALDNFKLLSVVIIGRTYPCSKANFARLKNTSISAMAMLMPEFSHDELKLRP